MTEHKITDSEGREYELTGEYRPPNEGEWYYDDHEFPPAVHTEEDFEYEAAPILRRKKRELPVLIHGMEPGSFNGLVVVPSEWVHGIFGIRVAYEESVAPFNLTGAKELRDLLDELIEGAEA